MLPKSLKYGGYDLHKIQFFPSSLLPVACCLKVDNISQLRSDYYITKRDWGNRIEHNLVSLRNFTDKIKPSLTFLENFTYN